jgi:hypothetical protein
MITNFRLNNGQTDQAERIKDAQSIGNQGSWA